MMVPTDGGRYDVDLTERKRVAVYWEEPESKVRRCSWFFKKETDRWYLPYGEEVAGKLEVRGGGREGGRGRGRGRGRERAREGKWEGLW